MTSHAPQRKERTSMDPEGKERRHLNRRSDGDGPFPRGIRQWSERGRPIWLITWPEFGVTTEYRQGGITVKRANGFARRLASILEPDRRRRNVSWTEED